MIISRLTDPLINNGTIPKLNPMEKVTFDNMPTVISELNDRLKRIEHLLENLEFNDVTDAPLMTVDQVAKMLHLSKSAIYAKVWQNEIPVSKKGRRLYFDKAEITAWVKSGKRISYEEKEEKFAAFYNEKMKRK